MSIPIRHFSKRGLTDLIKTLWAGWDYNTPEEHIWLSGDGSYGSHFKEIGKSYGPFDFAFMECGQSNDDWHTVHLFPNEAVRAAIDANTKKVMPVYWAEFTLSYQRIWDEFVKNAIEHRMKYTTPPLGHISY